MPTIQLNIIAQTVAIYLLIVVSLRLFGKKELAQLSVIDLVFILLISNSVQNAMVGTWNDFVGGLLSAGALFVVNFVLKRLIFRHKKLEQLIEGEPITLIYKGKPNRHNLEKTEISIHELAATVREHGVKEISDVDLAVLEVDGNISVLSDDFQHRSTKKRKSHKVIRKQEG